MSLPDPIAPTDISNGYVNAASFYFKIWTVINQLIAWGRALVSPAFVLLTFAAGFGNYGGGASGFPVSAYKNALGRVVVRGYVQNVTGSTIPALTIIALLPTGYAPKFGHGFSCPDSVTGIGRYDVIPPQTGAPNGALFSNVAIPAGGFILLDGISYYAGQ